MKSYLADFSFGLILLVTFVPRHLICVPIASECFESPFPRFIGGPSGDTTLYFVEVADPIKQTLLVAGDTHA